MAMTGRSANYRVAKALAPDVTENLERVMGIEPTSSAWKAAALPLSYTRFGPWHCNGGGSWIRTNVGIANGFTARPL